MATKKEEPVKPDAKGYVALKKGTQTARVLPASVEVWKERGWSVDSKADVASSNLGSQDEGPAGTKN